MYTWLISTSAANFGNFLTGTATLFAVVFGVLAVPRELKKWREQEKTRLQAEAAAKLQVAVIRFVQAIQYITSPLAFEVIELNKSPAERTYERFNTRLQASKAEIESYASAWTEGEVYLPDEIDKLNSDLWNLWVSIKVEFEMWYEFSRDSRSSVETKDSHRTVFGKETREKILKLESDIKTLLKPIASFEQRSDLYKATKLPFWKRKLK